MARSPTILLVEDDENDALLVRKAAQKTLVGIPISCVSNGHEAVQYLKGDGIYADRSKHPFPDIVLLDLKMPVMNGFEVLRWKQGRPELQKALWVALSNFDGIKTINEAYAAGATTFLTKPLDAKDIQHLIEGFNDYWQLQEGDARSLLKSAY